MENLNDYLYNGLFWLFALVIVYSACVVVFGRNLVRAGFALLFTFGGIAALYFFLGADFLAVSQPMIYVGGILVLILFGLMFTRIELGAAQEVLQRPTAAVVGFLIALPLVVYALLSQDWPVRETQHGMQPTTAPIGEQLLTNHLLPFEIASILLLVALVGAVTLTRRGPKENPAAGEGE